MSRRWRHTQEKGSSAGLALLRWVALTLGRPVIIALLYPIIFYYWLTARQARRASRDYLTRCQGQPPRWQQTYRHLLTFAIVACDRILLLSGRDRQFQIDVVGGELFDKPLPHGAILATAHLGSFDALRAVGNQALPQTLRILLDVQHNPRAMALISELDPALASKVIDASAPGNSLALKVSECLAQGDLVGIMADRCGNGEAAAQYPFLGQPASFPKGLWQLASALKVPVVACFGIYQGGNRYTLHFELIAEHLGHSRRERQQAIDSAMQHYCQRLEYHTRRHPYNWFNFYDFWENPD